MNSEQINKSDKLIQDMFSDMEIPTNEQDWQLMKKSLGSSSVGTTTNAGTTGASSSILPIIAKGIIWTTLGAVLLISSIFYFYNFNDTNGVSETLSFSENENHGLELLSENVIKEKSEEEISLEGRNLSNGNNSKNTSEELLINSTNSELGTRGKYSNSFNTKANSRDNESMEMFKKPAIRDLTNSKESANNTQLFTEEYSKRSTGDIISLPFTKQDEEYLFLEENSKDEGLLSGKFNENRIIADFGSLGPVTINDLVYNSKELNLKLPNNAFRPKLKLGERFTSHLILGLRSRAIPYPLSTEYESTGGVNPLAHFTLGLGLGFKFNNSISLSTSVSHLRVIAPQLVYISESYPTTIPITTLDWRFKRTVDAIYGIEIPLHLNYSPQSRYNLIDNLTFTAGLTSVISVYVKTIDEELIETIGSYKSEQPQGWESPSKFEGINKFDLGMALGFSYRINNDSELQLLYNYGFQKFVDDQYYTIDPLYNRNKNIQLTLKCRLN